jgi:hypothetical protein
MKDFQKDISLFMMSDDINAILTYIEENSHVVEDK